VADHLVEIHVGQPDRDGGGEKQKGTDAEIQPEVHVVVRVVRVVTAGGVVVGSSVRDFFAVIVRLAHGLV
jgi:hypothetical protein